jgi:TusA-related sulfurtransferase
MSTATEDLASIQSASVVDARSSACPGPLLEAKKGIGNVAVGEILEIWSGSQDTRGNLTRWCKKTGHDFLGFIEEGAYDRRFIRRNS